MAKFVRKLDNAVWWDTKDGESRDLICADALRNAATTDGKLSIYEISQDEDLGLILAALSYRRNAIRDADYCVFEESVFTSAVVSVVTSDGNTGCTFVDARHRDIVSLSAFSLSRFVSYAAHDGVIDSFDKSTMESLIKRYIKTGDIDAVKRIQS